MLRSAFYIPTRLHSVWEKLLAADGSQSMFIQRDKEHNFVAQHSGAFQMANTKTNDNMRLCL